MTRQRLAFLEDEVGFRVERDRTTAAQRQRLLIVQPLHARIDAVDVDRFRCFALETQDDCLVRAVAAAGGGKRAVQLYDDTGGVAADTAFFEPANKQGGGAHRSHGV